MSEIAAAMTSITTTWNLLKIAVDARDEHKIKEAIASMLERLLDAQSRALGLSEEIAQLHSKIRDLENERTSLLHKLETRDRYRLVNIFKGNGAFFVYQPVGGDEDAEDLGEASHFLCQPCFDSGKKSVLTVKVALVRRSVCGNRFTVDPAQVSANWNRFTRSLRR